MMDLRPDHVITRKAASLAARKAQLSAYSPWPVAREFYLTAAATAMLQRRPHRALAGMEAWLLAFYENEPQEAPLWVEV